MRVGYLPMQRPWDTSPRGRAEYCARTDHILGHCVPSLGHATAPTDLHCGIHTPCLPGDARGYDETWPHAPTKPHEWTAHAELHRPDT